jgi:hypothetical protein
MFYAFVSTIQALYERGPVHVAATDRGVAAVELQGSTDAFEAGLRRAAEGSGARILKASLAARPSTRSSWWRYLWIVTWP